MIDHKKLVEISEEAHIVFSELGNEATIASHNLLHSRIKDPQSYIAIVGETSSGKSTIINGLFEQKILPTKASPTTGTVTQIIVDNKKTNQDYFALNKDSSIEKLDQKMFNHLVLKPDNTLLRLQTVLPHDNFIYDGLNVFDTPGYNSLITEHEEILRDFISESDVIVHVVGYRMGFGQQDQLLLSSIYEQIETNDTPVILVINRCPENTTINNKRIEEVYKHAKDTIHKDLNTIIVPSIVHEDPDNPKDTFPKAEGLWNELSDIVNSNQRKELLLNNGRDNLVMLLKERRLDLEGKIKIFDLNLDEIEFLKQQIINFIESKKTLLTILDKYTGRWERTIPRLLEHNITELIDSTKKEIENENKWLDSSACTTYITEHYLPFSVRQINKNINDYLKLQLEEMNQEMEDVANQAMKKLSHTVDSQPSKSYSDIISVLVSKIGMRILGDTSKSILKGLGGVGGLAGGTGNLVKMGVKRFGNLFGKTFGREVYNAIGRTFTKKMLARLNVVVTIGIEVIVYAYDSKTWQGKLEKNISNSLNEFKEEATSKITKDAVLSIKKMNIDSINELYSELENDINADIDSINNEESKSELENLKLHLISVKKIEEKLLN